MTELVAVQDDFALFSVRGRAVIVDTKKMNASDPEPLTAALGRGGWTDPGASVRPLPVWVELAEAAVADVEQATTASADRSVRVPKRVKELATRGQKMTRGKKSPQLTVASRAADKLSQETVSLSTVKSVHNFFARTEAPTAKTDPLIAAAWLMYGGDAGRDWAARTVAGALVAAGEVPVDPDLPDPTAPHEFVPSVEDPAICDICGDVEESELHVVAMADGPPSSEYFAIFDPDFNGPTFKITEILAKDAGGAWWIREQGDWTPTEAPTDGGELTSLDEESLIAAIGQLDKPGATFAELSIGEDHLFELAVNEIDFDTSEAVFRLAPYVPPEVRSRNASKQLRDKNGRFFKPGSVMYTPSGGKGTVKGQLDDGKVEIEKEDGSTEVLETEELEVADAPTAGGPDASSPAVEPVASVARLETPLPLVPDVAARVQQYLEESRQKNAQSVQASALFRAQVISIEQMRKRLGLNPVVAAGDENLIPPPEDVSAPLPSSSPAAPSPAGDSPSAEVPQEEVATPENASNEPLYLAIVDAQDTQAVMDVVSIVPANATANTDLAVYRRVDGAWELAPDMLADLQGATPPPVAELDAPTLENVLNQMDPAGEAPVEEDPTAAPVEAMPVAASAAPAPYGVMTRHTLTAAGAILIEEVPAPPLFKPYTDSGIPQSIVNEMDQLAEGGADKNRGGAEKLRRYWTKGEGAAKIRWGTDGDWTRCVHHLEKYMGTRAKGYCTLRHKDALGYYPGELDRPGNPKSGEHATDELMTFEEFQQKLRAGELDLFESGDEDAPPAPKRVNRGGDDNVDSMPEGDDTEKADEIDPSEPHEYEGLDDAIGDGGCEVCGKEMSDEIHVVEADTADAPDEDSDAPADKIAAAEEKGATPVVVVDFAADEPAPEEEVESVEEVAQGTKFKMPLIIPEGVESGDGRQFAVDSLTSRDVPLAVMWQPSTGDGHDGAVIVGRLDHVERLEGGGLGNGYGVFDTGPVAKEAERLVRAGMLRGISADLDEFEADVLESEDSENKITSTKLMVNSGRLMGVTLVPKPAFAECTIELDEGDGSVADGEYVEETQEARVAALIASAAPVNPPKDWFKNPGLSKPTHLTVEDDGRVFGHIAAWDVDHIGLPFGTRAPRSASNYAYFRTGVLRTAEGEDVSVGQLTLAGGHAPMSAGASAAVKHYDDTASAWADVSAGEDEFGIWVAGALRPSVTPEQIRVARASSPSGDWRPIKGKLELVAACCVNVPGFPVARAQSMVAGGMVTALVAAGAMTLERQAPHLPEDAALLSLRIEALEAAERARLNERALAIRSRVSPVLEVRQAALTAAADQARSRVNARKAELSAQRDEIVARVASLRAGGGLEYKGSFDEKKHPRDHKGRFREVLFRLKDMMNGPDAGPGSADGLRKLEEAADAEDRGDKDEANRLAGEAAEELDRAASGLADEVGDQLRNGAEDVRDAVARLDNVVDAVDDAAGDEPVSVDDLPEALRALLEDAVDKLEQQINPADPNQMFKQVKTFLQGTNVLRPSELYNFLKRQVSQETVNKVAL